MNMEVMHRNAEHKAKCWLKEYHQRTHGTPPPDFRTFDGTAYEKEVARLAANIYNYVPEPGRYVETLTLDW